MTEKQNLLTINFHILSEKKVDFTTWQADFHRNAANAPGFVSLEILAHENLRDLWTIVLNFVDEESAQGWKSSSENKMLMEQLQNLTVEKKLVMDSYGESETKNGVTEVFITNVSAGKEPMYRNWISKIHQVEAQFPGFRGVYVQSPSKREGGNWITFLKFDSPENLDNWLLSSQRKSLLEESQQLIGSIENHRVATPYGAWFSNLNKPGEAPPLWKQTMLVLLVLFPLVMLQMRFLVYVTGGWDSSLATFLGNAISVTLISWPLLPIANKYLGWWLLPQGINQKRVNVSGVLLMLALYAFEIVFFWHFV